MMDYRLAVEAALRGEENAFTFLYETTQRDMYYIALKYMKNEDDALDVLQDAYIKAWKNLPALKDPSSFPGWLGRIVANTAKNMLVKKKPALFSQLNMENEDGDELSWDIEDEKIQYQPELHYTQQETKELVRELIDSLSDEQRLCILMYHLDGQSIRDIAQTFGISENTVKSRLLYGRKALKTKAEELKKRGYQLYSLGPVWLLLLLLRSERNSPDFLLAAQHALSAQGMNILTTAGAGNYGAAAAGEAAKQAFLHTAAGKVVAAALIVASIGAGAAGGVVIANHTASDYTISETFALTHDEAATDPEGTLPESAQSHEAAAEALPETHPEPQTESQAESQNQNPEETAPIPAKPEVKELTDDQYPQLLAQNLTKEELLFILAYGPEELSEAGLSGEASFKLLNAMCQAGDTSGMITAYGLDANYFSTYSLADVNRLFAAFSDYQFTEDNDDDYGYAAPDVRGDILAFSPATLNYTVQTTILSASYTDEEMVIRYQYNRKGYDSPSYSKEKEAILRPDGNQAYKIVIIRDADTASAKTEAPAKETNSESAQEHIVASTPSEQIYVDVLENAAAGNSEYVFPDAPEGALEYALFDMDQDQTRELILRSVDNSGPIAEMYFRVFDCESEDGEIIAIQGTEAATSLVAAADGSCAYMFYFSRGNGKEAYHRVTIENGSLQVNSQPEFTSILASDESKANQEKTKQLEWLPVSDISGLN